jgi:hypothetical protein
MWGWWKVLRTYVSRRMLDTAARCSFSSPWCLISGFSLFHSDARLPLIHEVCDDVWQNALKHISECPLPDFSLVPEIVGPSHHELGWHFDRRPVSKQSTADVTLSCFSRCSSASRARSLSSCSRRCCSLCWRSCVFLTRCSSCSRRSSARRALMASALCAQTQGFKVRNPDQTQCP